MTFNIKLSAAGKLRDEILARLKICDSEALVAENVRFNGHTCSPAIIGLGFSTEQERLAFLLEFKDRLLVCEPTDKQFKWGFDPDDIDF
jgi:hypothetical protein